MSMERRWFGIARDLWLVVAGALASASIVLAALFAILASVCTAMGLDQQILDETPTAPLGRPTHKKGSFVEQDYKDTDCATAAAWMAALA